METVIEKIDALAQMKFCMDRLKLLLRAFGNDCPDTNTAYFILTDELDALVEQYEQIEDYLIVDEAQIQSEN